MKFMISAMLGMAALLIFMFRNANNIKEKRHIAELDTVKEFRPFKLILIADIHRKKLPPDFIASPVDAIIIAGDLTEKGVPLDRTAHNLRVLTGVAPVYFVWGNNDREVGERNLRKLLDQFQVEIMDNKSVELFGQSHLKLVGIDYFTDRKNKLKQAFAEVGEEDVVLFVAHTPAIFNSIQTEKNADFLMAGHTHGGQIRLGRFGLYKKGSFQKTDSGYELVTNGYGTTSLPLRLGAEAQYHIIEIIPRLKENTH